MDITEARRAVVEGIQPKAWAVLTGQPKPFVYDPARDRASDAGASASVFMVRLAADLLIAGYRASNEIPRQSDLIAAHEYFLAERNRALREAGSTFAETLSLSGFANNVSGVALAMVYRNKPVGQVEIPPVIYVQWADGGNIRKWQREPFEGGVKYVRS